MITYWSKLPISTEKGTKKEAGHSQSNQLNHFFFKKVTTVLGRNYSATATESAGAATLSAGTESTATTSSTTAAESAAAAALSEEPQEKSDALKTTASNKTNFFILTF